MWQDTTPEAEHIQREILRRLGPEARVRVCFELSEMAYRACLAGIAARHPGENDREIIRRYIRLVHGVTVPSEAA
ncbi:MAG TPA: hypothetical protein PLV42_10400 [bacterium]|nr:hypothetical protein [bacterium]